MYTANVEGKCDCVNTSDCMIEGPDYRDCMLSYIVEITAAILSLCCCDSFLFFIILAAVSGLTWIGMLMP
jgi:hypothetical protein